MLQMLKTYMDANWYREEGATAVEYGIMVAAIAAVIIAIVITLGGQVNEAFTDTSDQLGGLDGIGDGATTDPDA